MKNIFFIITILCCSFVTKAQDDEIRYTMAYSTITMMVKSNHFCNRYIIPGQEPVCGFYSSYNNTMYMADGSFMKQINPDFLYDALGKCIDTLRFDDGPRPYAMIEKDVTITRVDYETNTIYAKTDGAEIVIETFNNDIDKFYEKFYKHNRLGAVRLHLILRNWNYTPESEDSYVQNSTRIFRKIHFKGSKAKNEEKLLHEVEYQKEN